MVGKSHQNAWQILLHGSHFAKRSFLKYGGEAGAVRQLAIEAWEYYQRKTGVKCPVLGLLPDDLSKKEANNVQSKGVENASASVGSLAALVVPSEHPKHMDPDQQTLAQTSSSSSSISKPEKNNSSSSKPAAAAKSKSKGKGRGQGNQSSTQAKPKAKQATRRKRRRKQNRSQTSSSSSSSSSNSSSTSSSKS